MAIQDRFGASAPAAVGLLDERQLERYHQHAERLISRVSWESASGFELTDPIIDAIAAHAALLVAGFELATNPYRDITAVVVHGGTIVTRETSQGPVRGVVETSTRYLAGQAGHGRGPIVLDWHTAAREFVRPQRGSNVVYHEFAHKLDQLDGVFDGMPPLGSDRARAEWQQTFGTNFRRLVRRGSDPVIRAYGATNPAEYFAVTSELFFTVPSALRQQHTRLYERLADFYRQDPAGQLDGLTDPP